MGSNQISALNSLLQVPQGVSGGHYMLHESAAGYSFPAAQGEHMIKFVRHYIRPIPSKHIKAGLNWPASETTLEWRPAGGPKAERYCTTKT